MGANTFTETGTGDTVGEAFRSAVSQSQYDNGHSGYSGTLAEKDSFTEIDLPEGMDPYERADNLISESDDRINDKWGPAGAIKIRDKTWLFFGWASS